MSSPAVTFSVEPEENGKVVYMPVAAGAAGEAASSMVALRLRIRNNERQTVRLNSIQVAFPGHPSLTQEFARDEALAADQTRTLYLAPEENFKLAANPPDQMRIALFFDGHSEPKVLERALAAHRNPTPQGSYRFPGHTDDMAFDTYFTQKARHTGGEQTFAYDIVVHGWNPEQNDFTALRPGTDGRQNEDAWGWDIPIYAMADGVVIRARSGWEDNPAPGKRAVSRMGENEAGVIQALALTRFSQTQMASVVRTAQGTLKIIIWETANFAKTVTRKGEAEGEAINLLAADALTSTRLVTAVRTSAGDLKVIVWGVADEGNTVTPLGEREAGAVKAISLIKLNNSRFVTAVRTGEDVLRLIVWETSADGHTISLLSHIFAGEVGAISLTRLGDTRLVSAVRTQEGLLKLMVWEVADDGKSITRLGDSTDEAMIQVAVTPLGDSQLATTIRTAEGRLKVMRWVISASGQTVTKTHEVSAGLIQSLGAVQTFERTVTTAVITQEGTLRLILWDYDEEANALIRWGENDAGATDLLALEYLGDGYVATAVRTAAGTLKIITWFLAHGGGNSFLILHGDELVLYAHLRNGSVNPAIAQPGALVQRGQRLGGMGNSGSSSGVHWHGHAVKAPLGLTPQELIAADEQGDLTGLAYRPLLFHNAQTMRLAEVEPGIQSKNPFARLNDQGVYFERMAIWPGLTTPGIPTGGAEIAFHGVRAADYQTLFAAVSGAHYRLAWFDGYSVGNDLRFNVIFHPSRDPFWSAHHGLTGEQYQDLVEERKAQGFRPVHVNSYRSGSQTRYAVIFHQADGVTWSAYHDQPVQAHQARFAELKAQGFAPVNVSVVSINSERHYTALYEQGNVGGFELRSFLTPEEYQDEFDNHKSDGLQVAYVDAYQHAGSVRFSAIWRGDQLGLTQAGHGLTGVQYQQAYAANTAHHFLTKVVAGYAINGQSHFVGVWRKL